MPGGCQPLLNACLILADDRLLPIWRCDRLNVNQAVVSNNVHWPLPVYYNIILKEHEEEEQ